MSTLHLEHLRVKVRPQFLLDVYDHAMDGTIDYWLNDTVYEVSRLRGFRADVHETDGTPHTIDATVLVRGMQYMYTYGRGISEAAGIREAIALDDESLLDDRDVDIIVQYGLLGSIIYTPA